MVISLLSGRGHGAGLVAFVTAPPSRSVRAGPSWSSCGSGTWSTIALAVGHGLPVIVFPVGLTPSVFPAFGAGRWQAAATTGVWARGWRWFSA